MFWLYAKYMARKGHSVYVTCFKYDENSLARLGTGASNISIIELVPEVEHKGVLFQDFSANIKYIRNGFRILSNLYQDIDLVHSNTYVPVLLGGVIKKLFKKGHVVTIHDIGSIMGVRFLYRWFREGKNNALVSYIKALISVAYENSIVNIIPKDAIIVPSLQSKHDVDAISLNKVKVHILPNFIDTEFYEEYKSRFKVKYEPCLLYIGRLVFYKNVHILVKSFSHVLQHRRDAKLIIIGKGPLGKLLYSYIHKCGLEKNIIMLGATTQEEKFKYLSQCSAVLNLSIFEGFGITILESWFFEKPVIVSNVPPLNELVKNSIGGYIVDLRNQRKLVELILQLLDDPKLAQKMGTKGLRKVLEYYSPKTVITQLESIYNSIISNRR